MADHNKFHLLLEILFNDPYIREKYGDKLAALNLQPTGPPAAPGPSNIPDSPDSPVSTATPPSPAFSLGPLSPASTYEYSSPPTPTPVMDDDMGGYNSAMSDADEAPPALSNDGFTIVENKKGKRKAKPRSTDSPPPAKKQSGLPLPKGTPQGSRPSSPKPGTQPAVPMAPKAPTPPPLYIHSKELWTTISKACAIERINYIHARPTAVGIKVQVPTSADYRSLTRLLKERKVEFHTYALPEDRLFRCVIKRVPKELTIDEISEDLKAQGLPIVEVHRMHRGRNGAPYDMIIVVSENTPAGKAICDVKSICCLSGITIERARANKLPGQCHNCQLYGHAQRHCFARARCVKCLGDHATAECSRPKDLTQCSEPPSCVLCGEAGHPANYRGCPRAPRAKPQQRKLPSYFEQPTALRPQRPSPWNLLNHQQAFPALKPTQAAQPAPASAPAIPQLMAVPITPPSPLLASQPAGSPRASAPAPYNPSTFEVLARFFDPNIIARSNELHAKLRAAAGNVQATMALMSEYADLSTFFINFKP